MSDATTGIAHAKARVSTMPKLSPPSDGAASAFARSSSSVSSSWRQEAEDVDPSSDTRCRGEQEPHRERVGADEPQPRAGPPVDRPATPEQDRHPLARVVPADEDDRCLAVRRVGRGRDRGRRSGSISYSPGEPARGRVARLLGDGDPVVDPVEQEAPERQPAAHPAEVAGRMERGDERAAGERERRDADRRRHRLVQVEDVEPLALEDALRCLGRVAG